MSRNAVTLNGKIVNISAAKQVTDTFRKREFIVAFVENPTYPEEVKFEMIQDNCENLDGYAIGDDVEIDVNIKGRKWTDPKTNVPVWFNTLQVWRIRKDNDTTDTQAAPMNAVNTGADDDDLPF